MAIKIHLKKLEKNYKDVLKKIYVESEFIDPIEEIVERIETNPIEPVSQPFIAEYEDRIISFFTIESSNQNTEFQKEKMGVYWLESFFVTKPFIGKGYAKYVVNKLLYSMHAFYNTAIALNLTVNFRNDIAQHLYKRCGFRDTGEIYAQGPAGLQYIYSKKLEAA